MGYNVNKINRIEIIDDNGRSFVSRDIEDLQLSFQDAGKTLKLFIKKDKQKIQKKLNKIMYHLHKLKK